MVVVDAGGKEGEGFDQGGTPVEEVCARLPGARD